MKIYYIISKKQKEIYYISPEKKEIDKYWDDERLDKKYYEIKETKSEKALSWSQGKINRQELIKYLEK